jgi:hypothetical protein
MSDASNTQALLQDTHHGFDVIVDASQVKEVPLGFFPGFIGLLELLPLALQQARCHGTQELVISFLHVDGTSSLLLLQDQEFLQNTYKQV